MEVSENELWTLSYYRESELQGAIILGRLARDTDDDELRVHLTEQCSEEALHAWLWTQAILAVGGTPRRVRETYQSRCRAAIGQPTGMLELLVLTQIVERRAMGHFRTHLRVPGTHAVIAATLERLIDDKAGHLGWVQEWLDRYEEVHGAGSVTVVARRFAAADRRVYSEVIQHRDTIAALLSPDTRTNLTSSHSGKATAQTPRQLDELLPPAHLRILGPLLHP
ncbi:MAG: hypothetical protein NVS4B3_03010 [Gemmatimonadaceae bacterium]